MSFPIRNYGNDVERLDDLLERIRDQFDSPPRRTPSIKRLVHSPLGVFASLRDAAAQSSITVKVVHRLIADPNSPDWYFGDLPVSGSLVDNFPSGSLADLCNDSLIDE